MELDTSGWTGEGTFTQTLIDLLRGVQPVDFVRVENAPSTRSEADYNFVSNEVFVKFASRNRLERVRRLGFIRATRTVAEKVMTLADLEAHLADVEGIGAPDYSDETMLQYLRTERIVPPYQTRGYKLVELVRIYEVGSEHRRG